MATTHRIKNLERALSPKQIVLLEIQEWRRHSHIVAYAKAVASGALGQEGTLCMRVEKAVQQSARRTTGKASPARIREAQREALFLITLAEVCAVFLAESEAETLLRGQLVAALGFVALLAESSGDDFEKHRRRARVIADEHVQHLGKILRAVELVQVEYFDGQCILFAGTKILLNESLAKAEALAEVYAEHAKAKERSTHEFDLRREARAIAEGWIMEARMTVHHRMGEEAAAMRLAKSVLE